VLVVAAPVSIGSAAGNRLPYAPEEVFTLSGNYVMNLGAIGAADFHVTVSQSGGYDVEADNVIKQPAYTKVNALAHWSTSDGRYGVSLWGRNLTNEKSFTYAGTLMSGIRQAHYEPPRTYGVSFEYHLE
jgi:iron complex outermembrane receptor protein